MLRILPLVLFTTVAATAADALGRADLPALAATFVEQERADADADHKAAIAACLVSAFDGIGDDELAPMLAHEGDFEESIDALLAVYPEREAIIEVCEDL